MEVNHKVSTSTSLPLRLEGSGLCFAWPSRPLFWEYNFAVGAGITWLRGRNGAGKTTLLKLLAGALEAQRGEMTFNGIRQTQDGHTWRLQTFWCSSETPSFSWLSVQDFFDLHLSLYPLASAKELNRHVQAFGLLPMLSQTIATLSLGQHKKIHLALALALPVKLLLIDEPFNALDLEAAQYLRTQLHEEERLRCQCILMTSHVIPDVPLVGEMVVGD
jgi:ABC-2 type transport system ATP-binding protein